MDEGRKVASVRGATVKPGHASGDPRWLRPLPWVAALKGPLGPWGFLTAGVLAGVNVLLPWLIIRLVRGKRRSFSTARADDAAGCSCDSADGVPQVYAVATAGDEPVSCHGREVVPCGNAGGIADRGAGNGVVVRERCTAADGTGDCDRGTFGGGVTGDRRAQ